MAPPVPDLPPVTPASVAVVPPLAGLPPDASAPPAPLSIAAPPPDVAPPRPLPPDAPAAPPEPTNAPPPPVSAAPPDPPDPCASADLVPDASGALGSLETDRQKSATQVSPFSQTPPALQGPPREPGAALELNVENAGAEQEAHKEAVDTTPSQRRVAMNFILSRAVSRPPCSRLRMRKWVRM